MAGYYRIAERCDCSKLGADYRTYTGICTQGKVWSGYIAHGCNSVLATKLAMTFGEYAVAEAGLGASLGAEKFYDIKCRKAGLRPKLTVIVATAQGLKMHWGSGCRTD